jgi:hypothetical protein
MFNTSELKPRKLLMPRMRKKLTRPRKPLHSSRKRRKRKKTKRL